MHANRGQLPLTLREGSSGGDGIGRAAYLLRPAAVLGRDRIQGAEQDGSFGQVQRQTFGGKGCVHGLRRRRDAHSNDAGHVSSAFGNVVQHVVQPVAYCADAGAVPI